MRDQGRGCLPQGSWAGFLLAAPAWPPMLLKSKVGRFRQLQELYTSAGGWGLVGGCDVATSRGPPLDQKA